MNPSAPEFVPHKKRQTGTNATLMPCRGHLQSPPQHTTLRATAPAFVPMSASTHSPMGQMPFGAIPPPPSWKQSEHVDPNIMWGADVRPPPPPPPQLPSGPRSFSLNAAPYTPLNPKISSKCPAPPSDKHNGSISDVSAPSQAEEQRQKPEKEEIKDAAQEPNTSEGDTQGAAVPVEEPPGSPSNDENAALLAQTSIIGEPVENDFSNSLLPTIFGISVLNKPSPAEPLRFNTVWALYADEHPTPFGAPLAYQPVLIHLVGDVETFWRLWRFVPPPSALLPAFTYHWFRRDIKPNWEHARNKNGGTITVVIFDRDKPGQNSKQTMDDAFMTMLMACCGESLDEAPTILNGIMLKVRQNKPTTLQIWTASSDELKLKALGGSLRSLLDKVIGPKPLQKLEYFSHQQSQGCGPGSLAGRMKGKSSRVAPDFVL
ncbi:putative Eukaryotic initiation factor 4E [Trypanosoma vivax]|nr:putative eukaryotic translation initiation factor,putative [Trypanosoma vivax]KAH8608827.1 putative Eukaryotic initiation factor 4E [Trypanosoma vivax]